MSALPTPAPPPASRTALSLNDLPVPGGRVDFDAFEGDVVLLRGATPQARWRVLAIAAGHAFGGPGGCRIDGQDTRALDRAALALLRRRSVARVLRTDRLPEGGNLLTAVAAEALGRGVPAPVALHRAAEELDQIGLAARMGQPLHPGSVSNAEERLLLIARARATRPCLLVVECADKDMDAAGRTLLRGALAGAAEQGSCVLMTAQHPSFAAIATRHLDIGPLLARVA